MSLKVPLTAVPIRAARWSALHPWRAIGCWAVFVVAAVALAVAIPTEEPADADYRVGESGRADALLAESGLAAAPSESVLVTSRSGGSLDPADAQAAAAEVGERLRGLDGVVEVGDAVASPDDTALLVPVELENGDMEAAPLVDAVAEVQADHPDLALATAGDVTVDAAIDERVGDDLARAELTSIPVTLVLMLIAFGALVAAGLPVLLAGTSVAATLGISAPLSHLVAAEPTVSSMIVLIGMAVGVDYSLFYLKRERQERAAGRTTLDAVEIAAETSGHAILVSGGAVIAALAGLYVMGDPTFDSLATGAIVVVAVAVLGSITVLLALLVKLGRWVDRPRVPLLWRLNRRIGHGGISSRLLDPVVRHPVAALVAAGVVVGVLAVPALGMRTHTANLETLPDDLPAAQTLRTLSAAFPSEGTTAAVVATAEPGEQADVAAALTRLESSAVATGDFTAVGEAPTASADSTTTVLRLAMPYDESDDRAAEAITELRTLTRSELAGAGAVEWAVGGDAAESLDYTEKQGDRLPLMIGFVLLLTMLMMGAAFRSVPLALVSTVLNLASVGVAFGLLAVVFQHGVGESLLDFTSPGFVISWIPVFVMVVLVGLSMDYHVFVLSRIRELVERGVPTRLAVRRGIADTAGVVTSAAVVMVSVFALFATLSMLEMKMMGVGLAGAILLDATLVRLVVLPAVLVLLGDRAWWPRRVGRAALAGTAPAGADTAPTAPGPGVPAQGAPAGRA
ncbi:MMPL family transporter [Nocardioides sp. SYSU DS0651]|uniref:MMPL family transporter n=1 Tax=Nocardioides sp. SYSU DS0651 TaxID=3415955 RepID=UPI003F4B287D